MSNFSIFGGARAPPAPPVPPLMYNALILSISKALLSSGAIPVTDLSFVKQHCCLGKEFNVKMEARPLCLQCSLLVRLAVPEICEAIGYPCNDAEQALSRR